MDGILFHLGLVVDILGNRIVFVNAHQPHVVERGLPGLERVAYASRIDLRVFPYWAGRHVENLGLMNVTCGDVILFGFTLGLLRRPYHFLSHLGWATTFSSHVRHHTLHHFWHHLGNSFSSQCQQESTPNCTKSNCKHIFLGIATTVRHLNHSPLYPNTIYLACLDTIPS